MRTKGKFCKGCKLFDKFDEELNNKDPLNCIKYLVEEMDFRCPKVKKITRYLNDYFPIPNLKDHLYDEINNETYESIIKKVLEDDEEFSYYSVRIPICGIRDIGKSTELWRSKTLKEADKVADFLNGYKYYWIPTESEDCIFVEKIYL